MRRGLSKLAPLLLLLSVTVARAQPEPDATEPVLSLPKIDLIEVHKADRTMILVSGSRIVHVIDGIQLGDQPTGPKRFEGDERTPEGRYLIDGHNPNSAYHLSLHISYPNTTDRSYAARQGQSPGGMVMIHGQPNGLAKGRIRGDWTDGCIALSNQEIEALWDAVPDGTQIDIFP